tara:strand:+ start:146 stop:301 length:156 start_codon:yes stop_codon:yes gene_type:complete
MAGFISAVGQGVAASFMILGVAAVSNGISTYVLNGSTLRDVVAGRFGGGSA